MTDTTVAPSGGAPAAAPNEVVVEQSPTSLPNAVGSQAPDKPVEDIKGSPHRPQSRRETIQAAFDRAIKAQETGERQPANRTTAKPAEAKPGHNQPPEEVKPEKPPQHREGGRFARKPAEGSPEVSGRPAGGSPQVRELPAHAPYREPLPRMRDGAKADWHNTPETVRGEVHRMAQEFQGAYERYRGDSEAMEPIRRFHDLAQSHGTTLERALTNYVSMEEKLRSDPIAGLDIIVNNLGLTTPDGQRLGLRDIAYHVLSSTPEQLKQIQHGNMQQAANQQIGALHQEVAGLKNALQQMHTQQQFTQTRGAVDQFADDGKHPRFDELGEIIRQELSLGFDLETAYKRAELLRPATLAAQTRTPSAQTRQVDRSIHGAPSGPSNGSAERRGPPPSRREAISRAIKRVNGTV